MSRNYLPPCPPSKVCPFVPGEEAGDRHQRRMETAVSMLETARSALSEIDDKLEVRTPTEGHWQVRDTDRQRGNGRRVVAQWWPQSGRFVVGEDYARPSKCHDVHQFVRAATHAWFAVGAQ